MKTSTKILLLFGFTIILIFGRVAISNKLQLDILNNTLQIKDIEAPLDTMSEQVIGYDGILTSQVYASLLHAQNGEYAKVQEHKDRYNEIGAKLDDMLKRDAKALILQSTRPQEIKDKVYGYLKLLDEENIALVDLETKAFAAIDKKDTKTAASLVLGAEYDKNKNALYNNFRLWADTEHEMTTSIRNDIYNNSQQLININLGFSLVVSALLTIVMLMLRPILSQPKTAKILENK